MQQNSEKKSQIDWENLIAEQEKSGLTQKEFCTQRGLVLHSLFTIAVSGIKVRLPNLLYQLLNQ